MLGKMYCLQKVLVMPTIQKKCHREVNDAISFKRIFNF